jgi:hypothetical protein
MSPVRMAIMTSAKNKKIIVGKEVEKLEPFRLFLRMENDAAIMEKKSMRTP